MPFIIHNENRPSYISALKEAQVNGNISKLVSLFQEEQTEYEKQCALFGVQTGYENYL